MNDRLQKRWGIIGDGQLARMLALAAYPLGIRPILLTSDANSSAGQTCPLQVRGSVQSRTDLHALLSQVDYAIIESEFVNCDALEATNLANKVIPSVSAIRVLQNKLEQKKLLKRLEISTSALFEQSEINSLWLDRILSKDHPAVVLKFATLGYDGKGVCVLNKDTDDRKKAETFLELAKERNIQVFAEEKVDFTHEVAMVAVRSSHGEFISYPLVISEQTAGICNRVTGPATALGVDPQFEKTARAWCERIATDLQIVGTFAVEFFITKGGSLLVNEIAPRVHNSGHYTQNAGCVSQFENHWRAVCGMPLGSTRTTPFFAMQNILGLPGRFSKESAPLPKATERTAIHWYGKSGMSQGRKLGHINGSCLNLSDQDRVLEQLSQVLKLWQTETEAKIPLSNLELKL